MGIQNGYSEGMTRMDEIKYLEMFLETRGTSKRKTFDHIVTLSQKEQPRLGVDE